MSMINWIISRSISTSSLRYGKRNFGKILLNNKRGTKLYKKEQFSKQDSDIIINSESETDQGVRETGFYNGKHFTEIKEMIPELIVPNLNNFFLKPYVSYKSEIVYKSKFTSKELFNVIYKKKIIQDFYNGKLDSSGKSLEPSQEEILTPNKARRLASKSGSDVFTCTTLSLGTLIPSYTK